MERLVEELYTFKGKVEDCENDYIIAVQEKLREYEDAEKQGLLLRLPCKDGTTVYVIADDCDYALGDCRRKMTCKTCEYRNLHIEQETLTLSNIVLRLSDFGKTVFLTQIEAEQKLKEMESKS